MEKAGNVDTGTLEHFTNYKYAPTRSTPLNVFALTNGNGFVGNGLHSPEGRHAFNSSFMKNYSTPNANMTAFGGSQRPAYSTESEMTSMTSLSNHSARNTPPNNQDTTQLPQAEE